MTRDVVSRHTALGSPCNGGCPLGTSYGDGALRIPRITRCGVVQYNSGTWWVFDDGAVCSPHSLPPLRFFFLTQVKATFVVRLGTGAAQRSGCVDWVGEDDHLADRSRYLLLAAQAGGQRLQCEVTLVDLTTVHT